jgi:hypothetical protein
VTPIRALFAVPLCLVLPGYAITMATFPRRQLSGLQTMALTAAMSLCTLALGSLVLDLTPGGIRTASWIILLVVVIGAACAVAVSRRGQVSSRARRLGWNRPRPHEVILLVFAALAVTTALLVSRAPLGAPNAYGYTQFWMVQNGSQIHPAVRIGVQSGEKVPVTYRVVLSTGARKGSTVTQNLTLEPGSASQITVPLRHLSLAQNIVTARLYVRNNPSVYRTVTAVVQAPVSPLFGPPDQPGMAQHPASPLGRAGAGSPASLTGRP